MWQLRATLPAMASFGDNSKAFFGGSHLWRIQADLQAVSIYLTNNRP